MEIRYKFREKFPEKAFPVPYTIRRLCKFIQTGSVNDEKSKRNYRLLTEAKLDDIAEGLEHFPQKTLKLLGQETEVSKSSAGVAKKIT